MTARLCAPHITLDATMEGMPSRRNLAMLTGYPTKGDPPAYIYLHVDVLLFSAGKLFLNSYASLHHARWLKGSSSAGKDSLYFSLPLRSLVCRQSLTGPLAKLELSMWKGPSWHLFIYPSRKIIQNFSHFINSLPSNKAGIISSQGGALPDRIWPDLIQRRQGSYKAPR